jgi:GAF domain-containing protein
VLALPHGSVECPSRASQEAARLAALRDVDILDTPGEKAFDDIIRLAANALSAACAAISLIDEDRQWFKARHGFDMLETPRDVSFCTHAVAARQVLIVPDASLDARFRDNPFVTCEGGVRFYAGFR